MLGVPQKSQVQVVLTGQHTFLESDPWDQTVKMQGPEVSEDSLLEAQPPGGFVSPNELDVQNGQSSFCVCLFTEMEITQV